MSSTPHIAFIGAGNMARALIEGLLQSGTADPGAIIAHDIRSETLTDLATRYGIATSPDLQATVQAADTIMLCVKPQTVPEVLGQWPTQSDRQPLLISVAAGIPTSVLEALLPPGARVIRAMPNTPALVKAGATGLAAGKHAGPTELQAAERMFAGVGMTVVVPEPQLDAVTGVSGSGPAYVFRFAEALAAAGHAAGLDAEVAERLALQTLVGAATLLQQSNHSAATLREQVTSKGGTTAAGLAVLEEAHFANVVHACVRAATRRSAQLGAEAQIRMGQTPTGPTGPSVPPAPRPDEDQK